MTILAIGVHPADAFDLSGGTLANFSASGHKVVLAVVTHGAYSHSQTIIARGPAAKVQDVITAKKRECEEAAQHIGLADVRYLEFDDEPFIPTRAAILALAEYVREQKPDVVISHHPKEYSHPDHPVVGDMALRALKAAERWLEGSRREPHPMKRVYFFGTQFRGICSNVGSQVVAADFVVDISRSIEKKKKALVCFQSQAHRGAQYGEDFINERIVKLEGYWGLMNGVKYAEEFIALTPQVVDLLP